MAHDLTNAISNIEVKKINRHRIFQLIYQEGPVSKQHIADALNMSIPTVLQNLKELSQQNLITEEGFFASTGGRKAKAITYIPNAKFSIGLDITANHLSIAIINLGVEILLRRRIRLRFEDTSEYFSTVGLIVRESISEIGINTEKILGVGISVPAHISKDCKTVVYAPILNYTGGTIDKFAQYLDYPCRFTNDANAACIAEYWNVNNLENIIYLSLSNSVGGAICLNNTFYPGENQRSAEFGHITLYPNGKPCYCGRKGCVDAYCNTKILSDSCYGDLALFFEKLSLGSAPHQAIWNEYLENLAFTINTLRISFDCKIVLGGYLGGYIEKYLPQLQEMVAKLNSFEYDGSYLEVCRYKFEASSVGAALQYISDFLLDI